VDTPGLQAASSAVAYNARVLAQIRRAHKKYRPDNVLYFDRMDMVRLCLSAVRFVHPVIAPLPEALDKHGRCGASTATCRCCAR
jgi:hypothetical protein